MKNKNAKDSKLELKKLMYISSTLLLTFVILYLIAYFIIKNKAEEKAEIPSEIVQYDEILISNISKQSEKAYYVLIYSSKDNYSNFYSLYMNMYKGEEKIYYADLNNSFNEMYKFEESKYELNSLQISEDVLFKIQNGKIVNTYTGANKINEAMREMVTNQ